MTDETQDTNDTPEPETLDARYDRLQAAAAAVNHQLRLVAVPGPPVTPGMRLTVKPIEADAMGLPDALDWVETYLATDEAKTRGELYAKRAAATETWRAALKALGEARRAKALADEWVEADASDTVSDAYVEATLDTEPE